MVLVYGSTTRSDLKAGRRTANLAFGARGPVSFEVPYGHTIMAKYAMATKRHMHEYGTTIEQLAEVAVSARYNAQFNPDAYYQDQITIDDVQSGRMIADPFTKLHCCIRSDGGCATEPVWILGSGQHTSHSSMTEWDDFTVGPAAVSGRHACERAGVTPDDIDLCCIYDAFTGMLLFTLEDLGFCAKGDGGPFVADGRLRLGGKLPTNPDGGGLSACHPGMRGLFLLVEAAKQLRGDYAAAGAPQRHHHPRHRLNPPGFNVGGWRSVSPSGGAENRDGDLVGEGLGIEAQRHAEVQRGIVATNDAGHHARAFGEVHHRRDVGNPAAEGRQVVHVNDRPRVQRGLARRADPAHVVAPTAGTERPGIVVVLAAGVATLDHEPPFGQSVPVRSGLVLDGRQIEPRAAHRD